MIENKKKFIYFKIVKLNLIDLMSKIKWFKVGFSPFKKIVLFASMKVI